LKEELIMASSLIQVRLDDDLKSEASALYDALGLDLPTAIRMFLKRSVMVQGIPFSMTLPANEYQATRALRAMQEISEAANAAGVSDMTPDEINAEINAARNEQKSAEIQ
jgi:DNA-damage-inducible protein J